MKRSLVFCFFVALTSSSGLRASTVSDTLYLNRSVDSLYSQGFYFCAFNYSPTFSRTNAAFKISVNDTLKLVIVNTDSVSHTFTVDTVLTSGNVVAAYDTINVSLSISQQGTYRFYSAMSNGWQLGASGQITVGYTAYSTFQWNLFEQDSAYANMFHMQTMSMIDTGYMPAIHLINGKSYPMVAMDTNSVVTGLIGDSLIISILNSGHMSHSVHFHGYHVKILTNSHSPHMINWEKDSFPMLPGSTVTLLMVPDKDGMFPVHDHNLISSTNAGMYPGGMMAMIDIMP